jgi:hypothetical protein
MRDLKLHFAHDGKFVLEEKVVILMDAAASRVLDWQDAVGHLAALDRGKHLFKALAGRQLRVRTEPQRGRLTVRSRLALIRNTHA